MGQTTLIVKTSAASQHAFSNRCWLSRWSMNAWIVWMSRAIRWKFINITCKWQNAHSIDHFDRLHQFQVNIFRYIQHNQFELLTAIYDLRTWCIDYTRYSHAILRMLCLCEQVEWRKQVKLIADINWRRQKIRIRTFVVTRSRSNTAGTHLWFMNESIHCVWVIVIS